MASNESSVTSALILQAAFMIFHPSLLSAASFDSIKPILTTNQVGHRFLGANSEHFTINKDDKVLSDPFLS